MPTTQHIQSSGARRRTPLSNLLISIGAAATAVVAIAIAPVHEGASILRTNPAAAASGVASQRPYTYGWPVAPFNEQHPVRGHFADPRTTFDGPPTLDRFAHDVLPSAGLLMNELPVQPDHVDE